MDFSSGFGGFLGILGLGLNVAGKAMQAEREKDVGDFNANVLMRKAEAVRQSQELLEQRKRKIAESVVGQQTALYAKSGIKMSGSALDVVHDTLTEANLDIAIDNYNAEMEARGFEVESSLEKSKAASKASSLYFEATRTLLGGGTQIKNVFG